MATTWSKWNKLTAGCLLGCGLLVPAFNATLDPFSVLGTADWMRQGYNVNERYGKVEHLLKNQGRYDSFIMGSSIMGLFPPEAAAEVRPDGSWYNLSYLAGTPPEALRTLKFLKASGQPVRNVMMGVDMFAFRKLDGEAKAPWKEEHPLIVGENPLHWKAKQLVASTFLEGVEKVGHAMNERPRIFFDIEGTGQYRLLNWEREIAEDHEAFMERQIRKKHAKGAQTPKQSDVVMVQERFDELAEMKRWLVENGIEHHIWINPMHRANMATLSQASIREFRARVSEALQGDVIDYTARDAFSNDDRLWLEWKHVRESTGGTVLQEVLSGHEQRGEIKAWRPRGVDARRLASAPMY